MAKNNIKALSIQVNLNGLSFCILNRTSNTVEYLNTIAFDSKKTPYDTLSNLKSELSTNTVFSDDFESILVIHQNELSTLVPKEHYDASLKADYLKFNSKILKTDYITEDEIAINDSVNVYVPYVNINNYLFDTFGVFVYKHSSSVMLDSILQKSNASEDNCVYINVNFGTIEIIVVINAKLQLLNIFDFNTKEDFIYYVLFVFEQLKLDVETAKVRLSGLIDKNDELYNILYTYVRHIEINNSKYTYNFLDSAKEQPLHKHHLILNSF